MSGYDFTVRESLVRSKTSSGKGLLSLRVKEMVIGPQSSVVSLVASVSKE